MGTKFTSVYDCFLGKITDDMYMELTIQETHRDLQSILTSAIPMFEFPRKTLTYTLFQNELDEDVSYFTEELTSEEVNILAILMQSVWVQRQVTSIENIRMKYSGADFKMTSQAAHLDKLLKLQDEIRRQSHHLQRLYKRRTVDENGKIKSNWSIFGEVE